MNNFLAIIEADIISELYFSSFRASPLFGRDPESSGNSREDWIQDNRRAVSGMTKADSSIM
jgi:hypothetical protein